MAVEGRTHKPVVDHLKCGTCSVCLEACPAEVIPEFRREDGSVRGKVYGASNSRVSPNWSKGFPEPPCRLACPIHQDVRGYMGLIAEGLHREALELIRETNPLPSVCGYVCHHPCEKACIRGKVDDPLSIRALKRFLSDYDHGEFRPPDVSKGRGRKVAIVGGGPAGLTAAHDLAINGYEVEVVESFREPGGMLAWAIPDFRLPREALRRDIEYIRRMGVHIRTGVAFGKEVVLGDLRSTGAEAVILATGTMKNLRMGIQDEDGFEGLMDCLTFLRRFGDQEKIRMGDRALVIGGGNAAMDTARCAIRLGAKEVTVLYRRSPEEMPADREEVEEALAEGVRIKYLTTPVRVLGSGGNVEALECVKNELGEPDPSGRRRPVPLEGSEFVITTGSIISAIGQEPDYSLPEKGLGETSLSRPLHINKESLWTGVEGVFAAGDFASGASTVVEAMASGRRAGQAVMKYFER